MTARSVILRELARRDIEDVVDFYAREAGEAVAMRFVTALETTLAGICARPALGSPRFGHELGLPGLRSRGIRRFPYLVFYMEGAQDVDVWRVLHAQRDIPAWLKRPGP